MLKRAYRPAQPAGAELYHEDEIRRGRTERRETVGCWDKVHPPVESIMNFREAMLVLALSAMVMSGSASAQGAGGGAGAGAGAGSAGASTDGTAQSTGTTTGDAAEQPGTGQGTASKPSTQTTGQNQSITGLPPSLTAS